MLSGVGTLSCSGRGSLSLSLLQLKDMVEDFLSHTEPDDTTTCVTKEVCTYMFPSYKYVCSIVTTGC